MCGILGVYVTAKNQVEIFNNLKKIYEKQKNRGTRGCGLIILRDNKFIRVRGRNSDELFNKVDLFIKLKTLQVGDIVLIHHRYGTSGASSGNILEGNHPMCNEDKTMALIHNGVISDYRTHYKKLLQEGHIFETEVKMITQKGEIIERDITDSEIIVHYLEDKNFDKLKEINGSVAIAFFYKNDNNLYLYRKMNPIWVYTDASNNLYFSSEYSFNNEFYDAQQLDENIIYKIRKNAVEKYKILETPKQKYYNIYDKKDKIFDKNNKSLKGYLDYNNDYKDYSDKPTKKDDNWYEYV